MLSLEDLLSIVFSIHNSAHSIIEDASFGMGEPRSITFVFCRERLCCPWEVENERIDFLFFLFYDVQRSAVLWE
jgi:hypothetical protein